MTGLILSAAWGDCDTTVLERSARENAPDAELHIIRSRTSRPGFKDRWRWFEEYLTGCPTDLPVLTVDARDTVIQADPFAGDDTPAGPVVFAEPTTVRAEPWNRDDYTALALALLGKTPVPADPQVINGGFVLGWGEDVGDFCAHRWSFDLSHPATDQAGVTFLVAAFPHLARVLRHGDGGAVYHGHWWAKDGKADEQVRACRPDGTPYPVFHQWDRTPLAREVRRKYGR